MSEILCQWLNQDLKVSQTVTPKSFAKAFSSGYLIGEVLHKFELQDDFSEFSESRISSAKLNNFSRLEPTLHRLGVQFDQNIAHSIITEKPGVATKLLYQMYIALQKKKKSGLAGVEITSVQPLASVKLQNMKSEAFRDRLRNLIPRQTDFSLMQVSHRFQEKYKKKEELDHTYFEKFENVQKFKEDQRCVDVKKQRLSKRRQNEIMAQIQAAIIQIPKPAPSRAFKALEAQKLMKKKKEAEDVANEIKKFEALIKKDLQAKESASKPHLDTSGQTATDLLNTYSDDDYIKKIQKRLEEDAFAREQREKRRRRLLMDQLIAHEAQEEAYREEQLINRLMRQSQQERRIAVQLMHVRHEKEVLWQNRIFREKQFEERRLKDFQDALDREAALAKQAKMNSEEQALREKEVHDKIAVERAQARYEKHYSFCGEILDQILDLSTKVADYRMLTNNLIPAKMMHDWKELFFNGKPIYEQASLKPLQTKLTGDQLIELEKRDLLDKNDFDDYKNLHGEWTVSEELADNLPTSNNSILGHIIHRLIDKSLPSTTESKIPELPSFALKGCLLGKTFSGKTTVLKFLQKEFPIHVLSIDTLVQEAIQAYHNKEKVIMVQSAEKESEESVLTIPTDSGKNAEHSSNEFSANSLSNESLETEAKTIFSKNGQKTPKDAEVKPSETTSYLSVRANLGEKSESMLKKGKSIPDILLVSIMANAIHQIPMDQGWILDGFPMTLNQAKLLEEALTGYSRSLQEQETERSQTSVLAVDPATSKEVIPHPSAFDFVLLLNVSDNCSLSRMNQNMAEPDLNKTPQEDINQRIAAEKQNENGNKNLRAQIQHRIVGFLDNWPSLEQWFTEPKNILIPVNAEVDEQSLCEKVKEVFMNEMVKKQDEVKAYLERKEDELKEVPAEPATPPLPSPEPEKEKETPSRGERSKSLKGRRTSEHQQSKPHSPQEGKRKKGDPSLKRKGSPRGKSAGAKAPVKTEASELQFTPVKPPLPKPGSDDWIYVNEPIPEEICSFLAPYWQLIENSYIDNVKIVLRHLREDQHTILAHFYDIRTNFQRFLRRPDYKQDFVSQWQSDFNSLPDDLWDDEETKCELHQRVNDLRDRLWDICDARKEEAEQECVDIINESWLQDMTELTINHFFSLMQAELNRFQDTKRFLQDYYRGMEGKIPVEDSRKFIRVSLIQADNKDIAESQVRIPLVPRISISPDSVQSKPKTKIEFSLEGLEANYESDEKLITDTWQQVSLAVSQMVAAEIHQRLEEEKENLQADQKERPPPVTTNKKGKKESPKSKKEEKKGKGKQAASVEPSPIILSAEEMAEMEKKNELRSKIKEEHFASLQIEEANTLFRLQLIKTKALAFLRDLTTKAVNVYKRMEHWLGQRYLKEMASVEKLTEVARYHIETSTRIQNELYLGQEDFFIDGNIKVFPDPPPPKRPPPVEKEENITLTIKQLDNLRNQFLGIAPKGRSPLGDESRVLEMSKRSRKLDHYLPRRNHQFLKIWLKKYPWLIYDEILNLMFCGLCRKHGVKSKESQVSLFYGTDNFRTEFLNAHHLSEAHAKASLMEATSGSPVNRATNELMVRTMSKVTLGRVENLFRSCHAIAKTGRPLKDFIWMCSLDDMKGVDIGPVFRTNRSARTFTYYIAEVERKNLREKLEKSKFFSVISDGVSDGAVEEAELVYVQFAYAGKVHCQIVGVQTIEKKDPLTRKTAIERALERNLQLRLSNQDWAKKLVGFGSDDGAPLAEREGNELASLLREIQPCVLTVCCFSHHLELAYKTVFQNIPLYNDVRELLQSIYHFYHNFPLHKSSLITAFRGLHLRPVMPSHVGGRRWLQGLQAALQNFLKGYPAIIQHLDSAEEGRSNSSCQKAKELLQSLLQADIVKFVHFLVDVINVLSILSRVSQNRNSSIADIFATLESTLEMLRIYQTRPGPKERRVNSDIHFPSNCLTGKGNISDVRNTILTHLIKRLQSCFRDASQDVVKATMIGSFRLWPAKINQEFGEKEVSILIAHYEPVLEAANVKIDEVDTEWSMLKLEIYAKFQNIRKLTWDFVNSVYLHKYPNILTLVDLVLTLPACSAEAERGFSQMMRTKAQMNAKIKADSMTDLLIIQLNSPDINNFDPRKAIHLWNTKTPSSIHESSPNSESSSNSESHSETMIGSKDFTDILLDSINLNLGSNSFPNSWMHLTQSELQELTYSLTVNSEFVDWRKFLLVTSMPWPIPTEEELLETLKRFKAVDVEQLGTVTLQQYEQAGLWFVGEEDVKIPEDPLEPLPFSRQKHLIEFFFRLFADYEKDPPLLDYTEMLLYFAAHPNPVEGVFRALSVAIGTHVFPPVKTGVAGEKVYSFTHVNATEQYSELCEKNINDERQLKEERKGKESEISGHANTEKISIDTLLKVFRGGSEAQDSNRFGNRPRKRNIYLESFKKTFHDLGAKNLEPIEVAVLLKHPFIQDLILTYPDYKIPDIKTIFQRSLHAQGSDGESSPSRLTEEKK